MIFKEKIVMRKVLYLAILMLIMSMIPVPFMGCSGTPGYVTETYTKRGINFSFEYPDDYEKQESVYEEESNERDYVMLQYYASTDNDTLRKIISIQLWNPTQDWQDAGAKLDRYAASLDITGEDVQILERVPLQVAGADGEKMVFSILVEDIEDIPNKLTGWIAAFGYEGQIWFLVVTTNMEPTDEVEADFVHLIESFKFQD
jgi:hypothetical protein